ncbi:UNVERIFIED_CONTAM: Sm-like protein LSM2 [Sesamum calycinum]|uniref:Sm-like protein LSM2 n=1 Tax=Sesamum calycinum TaxID=2727403 RepID=A0AAW2SF25_9LAMI
MVMHSATVVVVVFFFFFSNVMYICVQLFLSYFRDIVGREVIVEMKEDLAFRGTLHAVDQYLNFKLVNTTVHDPLNHPEMLCVWNCFIRGSAVRYVHLPPDGVDVELLQDATRREARAS